jgi:hypothetical protein
LLKEFFLKNLKNIAQKPIKNDKNDDGANAAALSTTYLFGAPTGKDYSE